ncbi:hypothetical protein M3175_05420 [Robertmurraya korlensis]|uniref:hypothetical protein n=1 Tax=Robertmurraya korlensis TaxID=519977 RepID=UPI00203AEC86|nr:hypothetical protein [Robertmurraya korlensis]MCM3600163.1 hypothetical protein [Robertmurraya korlensis]
MTSVFLFISIVLNIIALFSIVILYLRQSKLFEVEKKQQKMIEEMEDVISTYLAEMREENESFIKRMTKAATKQSPEQKNKKKKEVSGEPIPPSAEEEKRPYSIKSSKSQAVKAYKIGAIQPLTDEDVEVLLPDFTEAEDPTLDPNVEKEEEGNLQEVTEPKEKSLLEEVVYLQEQGLTYEEIAKKLHKGRTEIELLLKFRQNNQE